MWNRNGFLIFKLILIRFLTIVNDVVLALGGLKRKKLCNKILQFDNFVSNNDDPLRNMFYIADNEYRENSDYLYKNKRNTNHK